MTTRKRSARRSRKRRGPSLRRRLFAVGWRLGLVAAVILFFFFLQAYASLSRRLDGPVWDVPTRVVSAELSLRPGDVQPLPRLVERLRRSGYSEEDRAGTPGTFKRTGLRLLVRPFDDPLDGTLALDFRDDPDPPIVPTQLPSAVADACRQIAGALQLVWTGIDLRRTIEGNYYFFEANPSPMFLGFQQRSGLPLTDALVSLLV